MIKRLLPWAALAAIALALALAGFWLLFTTFMVYDDEGYVLISLKDFSEHGHLYDQVYSQYGPVLYLLYDALHRLLGFAFNNTTGRWITWVNWLGAAAACAALVGRSTRSVLWAGFTLAGVFIYLWPMIDEPIHPGGLIALLVALGAWIGAELWAARRVRAFAAFVALIGTLLALIKINVGVFFLGSSFAWLALNTGSAPARRTFTWLVALGCALLPFVLMQALFDARWVRLYALLFTGSALAILMTARMAARPLVTAKIWLWFAGIVLAVTTLACGLILVRGTSFHGLVDGVVLEPLKHPHAYFFPMRWRPGAGVLAIVSLAAAAWTAHRGPPVAGRRQRLACALLLATAAAFFSLPLEIIPISMAAWGMCYGVTLAWLCAVPLRTDDRTAETRAWIALLLVFQFLHAYPVAGSQLNWGTYLWIPLLALGLSNVGRMFGQLPKVWRRSAQIAGSLAVVCVTLFMTGLLMQIGWSRYPTSQPLGLPGAKNLRLPNDTTYDLRVVAENLHAHADLLFGYPGIYSANLWTGLPTPTLANATQWFSLLPPERQQAIITRMAASPRAVLLVQRDVLNYLAKSGFHPRGPLLDWLMANFQCAFAVDGYEFWVRRGRTIAALSTASFAREESASRRLELTVVLAAPARPIASVDICDIANSRTPLARLDASSTSISVEPVDLNGKPTSPPAPAAFPLRLTGVERLVFLVPDNGARIAHGQALIVLRDASGAVVAEAREVE